ncbi:Cof-type HAD-IIB family hydrolase [Dehalobacter restrictus]|uniref:Cof-type HAD-IIB family hydrolase n=1 Tax=Dehalobacter restrictus TaxID=55583 RepID=A0A857DNY2_9FIRM|nr:Cof-type HAD-IIB family hydrolase [Dehalobacter restrictus]QHA01696.1 Cof-type HAD-IIB family hydrolase [Dehalobacter restrictus]
MIRLVAIDLDETLLNHKWQISEGNIKAIRRAVAKGVMVTLATGRMAASARKYASQLGLDVPIITYNGALIEHSLSREIIYHQVIPSGLAVEIIQHLQSKEVYTQVFIKDEVFTDKRNQYSRDYEEMTGIKVLEEDVLQILRQEPEGAEKILCISDEAYLQAATADLRQIYADRLHFTRSKPFFLDMIDKEVNKGSALKALAANFGILPEEIIAIGDNFNDREMLMFAGIGVAMGNAHQELKEIADYITASNKEDGVAKVFEKFVL